MYTRLTPTLGRFNRHHPDQGSKESKPPVATEDTLGSPALHSSVTGPRFQRRSRLAVCIVRAGAYVLFRFLSVSSRDPPASLRCLPP